MQLSEPLTPFFITHKAVPACLLDADAVSILQAPIPSACEDWLQDTLANLLNSAPCQTLSHISLMVQTLKINSQT